MYKQINSTQKSTPYILASLWLDLNSTLSSFPKKNNPINNTDKVVKQWLTGCRGSASMGKRPLTISDCLACVKKLNCKLVNKMIQRNIIYILVKFLIIRRTNVSKSRAVRHQLPKLDTIHGCISFTQDTINYGREYWRVKLD